MALCHVEALKWLFVSLLEDIQVEKSNNYKIWIRITLVLKKYTSIHQKSFTATQEMLNNFLKNLSFFSKSSKNRIENIVSIIKAVAKKKRILTARFVCVWVCVFCGEGGGANKTNVTGGIDRGQSQFSQNLQNNKGMSFLASLLHLYKGYLFWNTFRFLARGE